LEPLPIVPPVPRFSLVSWPVRLVVATIAIGAAWMMLEGWAAGVRLSKMMSALGERKAAAEAALRAKRPPESGDDPSIVYIQPPAASRPR
jgi:hypothetical protein